jgi:hypothetical protein
MTDWLDTPPAPAPEPAPAAPAAPAGGGEEEAWAEVLAHWDDEVVHRTYVARFGDLEGLGVAGRRYRDVLARRPADRMAQRLRDVILKKATALGLAALPRTVSKEESPRVRKVKLALMFVLGAATLYLGFLVFQNIGLLLGSKP